MCGSCELQADIGQALQRDHPLRSQDNDCTIGNPYLRFHPDLPSPAGKWWMPYQHFLTIFGMSFGFFKWYVADYLNFKGGRVGSVTFHPNAYDWNKLLLFKIGWLFPHFFLPLYLHGVKWTLIPVFVYMVVGAQYLENTFIVNHVQVCPQYVAHTRNTSRNTHEILT